MYVIIIMVINMKILVIPSWYPYKKNPIWGNYFIKQAEELAKYSQVSMLHINRVGLKDITIFNEEKKNDGFSNKNIHLIFIKNLLLILNQYVYFYFIFYIVFRDIKHIKNMRKLLGNQI